MTLTSAVNHKAVNITDSYPQQECPTPSESAEPLDLDGNGGEGGEDGGWEDEEEYGPRPYSPNWGRRAVVIVMGMMLAGVVLATIGTAFMQGSWWHSYPTDQALDRASRTRLKTVRDEVAANGAVPKVVAWLDAALDPDIDPTAVRSYLLTAKETLKATGDPKLIEAAGALHAIIQTIRSGPISEKTTTPHLVPTLEGLGDG